jgi:aminoglycoside phosphotransferase family enzyme/predicted kinase
MSSILIKNLQQASLYPHSVNSFNVFETHSAWVITTGEWAYKIKKNVDFGFLDYSSLEKRRGYCEQEVALNSVLAKALYDSVVPIYGDELQPSFSGDKIIEYAIKMREFPQDALLSQQLADGHVTPTLLQSLAETLAQFHQTTPRVEPSSPLGEAIQVHTPTMENFSETIALLKDPLKIKTLETLAELTEKSYQAIEQVLRERKTQGFIRHCHGDLHLKNMVVLNNQPVLFDRIEFNTAFMWTDTMADLGFLLMDLDEKGATLIARQLRNAYMKQSGDYHGLQVLPYYCAYRAMVRAKVDQICLLQPALSESTQNQFNTHYEKSLQLVRDYLSPKTPKLIILYGLTGSGKSTKAEALLAEYDAIHLQADAERKRLFNHSLHTDTTAALNQGIYTKEHTEKVYQHLAQMTRTILQAGYTAVVDATFSSGAHRSLFKKLAEEQGVPFQIIHCQVPEAVLRERIAARSPEHHISNGTLEVLNHQIKNQEPLTEEELECCVQ